MNQPRRGECSKCGKQAPKGGCSRVDCPSRRALTAVPRGTMSPAASLGAYRVLAKLFED